MTAHAESEAKTQEFDPDARYVGEDCIEYRNFADFLRERPLDCPRNKAIAKFWQDGCSAEGIKLWARAWDGPARKQKRGFMLAGQLLYPAGSEEARSPEGAGRAYPGSPAPDPVHAAHQPALHGGMGA